MLQIWLLPLLLLDSGDDVLAMILLPWRHTSSCADFSPLLLQLGLARYTCGGKRILLGHDGACGAGGSGTELEGRSGGNDRCGFAHSSEAGGGPSGAKGEHSTGRGHLLVMLLLLATSKGEGSRRLACIRSGGKVEAWRRMRRERERFVSAVIVVVVVIVAAGAELEGRRGRLAGTVHRRACSKLKHLLRLGFIRRWRRGRSTERTAACDPPESGRCRSEGRCRRLAKDRRSRSLSR